MSEDISKENTSDEDTDIGNIIFETHLLGKFPDTHVIIKIVHSSERVFKGLKLIQTMKQKKTFENLLITNKNINEHIKISREMLELR